MKCELCSAAIEELFLKKIKGTVVKDAKGKKRTVCFDCQRKFNNDKQKMLEKL
jgi:ribosome-binding protein aMBF1 (putative translation factor)